MRLDRTRLAVVAVLVVAATVVLGACGSDDDGGSTGGDSGASATADGGSGGVSQESIDVVREYTGGGEGQADSSLEPLKVGLVVQKGGTPSFPENEAAAEAGAQFINEHLGGVDGHPVELVKCYIQAEEDGQKCGSQLLQADVPVGLFTIAVIGNSSLYDTIDGRIPLLNSVATLPQDTTSKDVFNFSGGAPTILYAKAADAANLAGGGKAAIVSVDNEGGKFATEGFTVPAFKLLGVEHSDPVYFPDDATTPELVSALQAAGGTSADVILLEPSGPQHCNALYEAMNQLGIAGTPVVATSICGAPSFVDDAAGGNPEGWRLWGFVLSPFLINEPEVQAYTEIMEAGGQSEYTGVGFAGSTMRDMMLLARFANDLGADKWTPKGFVDQILDYEGEAYLAPGPMSCSDPAIPEQPGLCGREATAAEFAESEWQVIDPIPFDPEVLKQG